jgi:large subunit ribosomal protein L23
MGILNRKKVTTEEVVVDEKAKPSKKKDVSVQKKGSSSKAAKGDDLSFVVIKPLVTEKSAILASSNQYVFVVNKKSNRVQIADAIKQIYGVLPISVNVMNVRGKRVRFAKRKGKRSDWKKAIVTLPKDKNINVYEGV